MKPKSLKKIATIKVKIESDSFVSSDVVRRILDNLPVNNLLPNDIVDLVINVNTFKK